MTSMLIQGGNVLNVETLTLTPADVLVENGLISQVGPNLKAPAGAQTIQAKGLTVMPGMIDCHTHVVASQLNLGQNANLPNALATLRAVPILSGILMRGFTTVRDAGGADFDGAAVGTFRCHAAVQQEQEQTNQQEMQDRFAQEISEIHAGSVKKMAEFGTPPLRIPSGFMSHQLGEYQIGELNARSCRLIGMLSGIFSLKRTWS